MPYSSLRRNWLFGFGGGALQNDRKENLKVRQLLGTAGARAFEFNITISRFVLFSRK